ncbi:LysR family transcriptional regulator [Bordetella sp. 02P26C-1]|uniref:LysR family transcriptional regulator n=1 Tax=Bordetella sp. 02P26C-1 TaxID=2683195 RepID=UPI0013554420|nr:LysR family transcriptional regulator [Bordetella sp. 02P26C-1]MVW77681.1 LysR family transcriptional regulator [Bordetella sp. 02P26C-1]
MNLTPRELRIFVSLASSLSFVQTADKFFVTQPTMSKMVKSIEDKLGVKLFERTTRTVTLTREGQTLLELAGRIIEDYEAGLAELAAVARRGSQKLAIAALPSLAATLLPPLIAELRLESPNLIINIHDVINDTALDLLRMRKVDFALSGLDVVHRDLSYIEIMREPFVLLGSDMIQKGRTLTQWSESELERLPIISMPRGTGTRMHIDLAFMKRGKQFRPFLEIQGLSTIGKFVTQGCGLALLPLSAAQLVFEPGLYIARLRNAPERTIGIITRHESGLSNLASKAIEWVRTYASLQLESTHSVPENVIT